MANKTKNYDKIMQLLLSDGIENKTLGIQLLKSTMDEELFIEILSDKSYISSAVCFPLITFFQEHPNFWEELQGKIPSHIKRQITEWMPHTILDYKKKNVQDFCAFATTTVRGYLPDFPVLDKSILTVFDGFYCGSTDSGENIKEGIGWKLSITEADIGPAETIHTEDWKAIACHPQFTFIITTKERGWNDVKTWLEIIPNKSAT